MKMKKSNSGGKLIVFIAAICIVIYIAALVQSVIRFYLSVEQRKTTAEIEFSNIADLASSAGLLGFMDEPFIDTINEALMFSKSIEAVIISGPEGEYAFERQKDRAISWVNNSPRFKNRFDFSGVSLYQPLRIYGLRNVNIQAVASAFDYAAITKILKETLFLILTGFILAFFTFLIQLLLDKSESDTSAESAAANKPVQPVVMTEKPPVVQPVAVQPAVVVVQPAAAAVQPVSVPVPDKNHEINRTYEKINLDEMSEAIANTQISDIGDIKADDIDLDYTKDINDLDYTKNNNENNDIEIDDIETNDIDDIDINDIEANNKTNEIKINNNEPKSDDNNNEINAPKGLYSQRSNIGWEEYTIDRLDSELHRCASTEKDLTLIVLEFTHGISDSQYASAADEAVNFFTSRDLLFENGKYGITIIYPGVDLETGIFKSQAFQRRINEKLKLGNEISIGLSSRSGRLLNSGRLLMEAMEALQKAKTDPLSSIIAFKSDPEKYRAFLGKQTS